jgi:hypothetical protein
MVSFDAICRRNGPVYVSLSIEDWPCLMASVSVCLTFRLLGGMPKSGKDRCSLAFQDVWQKWTRVTLSSPL